MDFATLSDAPMGPVTRRGLAPLCLYRPMAGACVLHLPAPGVSSTGKRVWGVDRDRLKLENGQDRPIFKHHGTQPRQPRQRRKRQMWMRIPMMLVRMGDLAFQMDELNQPPKWIGHVQCTVAAKDQNAGKAF